ncbi:MAG TPA: hypothetical protein VD927_17940 [Chryseosolibacter sp.]|nr:hypothetical protein [Chryseosolibacter sp.]
MKPSVHEKKFLFSKKRINILCLLAIATLSLQSSSRFTFFEGRPPEENVINGVIAVAIPPAPDAASLGKYGEFPVTEASGVPNISIPIYEVKSGSLTLPISLSYHASGIKVADHASWVGLGWSLNAGGVIARTMRGLPDEGNGGYLSNYDIVKDYNDYGTGNITAYSGLKQMAEGATDGVPDLFSFNFPGQSGKFLYTHDGKPHVIPHKPLKVDHKTIREFAGFRRDFDVGTVSPDCPDYILNGFIDFYFSDVSCEDNPPPQGSPDDSIYRSMTAFHITNENGVLYEFAAAEKTRVNLREIDQDYVSSWFLTRIISADQEDTINLHYKEFTSPLTYGANYSETIHAKIANVWSPPSPKCNYSQVNIPEPVVLERITFKGGELVFESSQGRSDLSGGSTLHRIKLYEATKDGTATTFLKQYDFHYGAFTTSAIYDVSGPCGGLGVTGNDFNRLKLTSLTEAAWDGATQSFIEHPSHYFTYNAAQLPQPLSRSQDFWGYYNAEGNSSLIPRMEYLGKTVGSADRWTKESAMKACVLEEITFPTGGKTKFDFEANRIVLPPASKDVSSPEVHTLHGINSSEGSHITKSWDWPRPLIIDMPYGPGISEEDIVWDSKVTVYVEFGTVPNVSGDAPYPYIKQPRFKLVNKTTNSLVTDIVYQETRPYYVNEVNGLMISSVNTSLLMNNVMLEGYSFILETSTDSRNYIKGQLVRKGTIDGQTVYDTIRVGGLRVKTITSFNEHSQIAFSKKYKYEEPFFNSGFDYRTMYERAGLFYREFRTKHLDHGVEQTTSNLVISGEPMASLTGGAVVSYRKITESDGKGDLGSVVTYYDQYPDQIINDAPYPMSVSNEWRRGQIVRREVLDADANILRVEANFYGTYFFDPIPCMVVGLSDKYVSNRTWEYWDQSDFKILRSEEISGWKYLRQSTIQILSGDNAMETVTSYTYDPLHTQLRRKSMVSNNETLVEEYTYPADYTDIPTDDSPTVSLLHVSALQEMNNHTAMLEHRTLRVIDGQEFVVSGKAIEYNSIGKPGRIFSTDLTTPVSAIDFMKSEMQKKFDERYVPSATVNYNVKKQVATVTDRTGLPKGYLWDDFNRLKAQGINASNDQLFYEGFEDPSENSTASKTGLRSHAGTYTVFKPAGSGLYEMSWWERGITGNSQWVFKSQSLNTSSVIIGSSTTLIDEVRVWPLGAVMSTYNYDGLNGIRTITDPNQLNAQYFYDEFGRLKQVKDDGNNVVKAIEYNYKGSN